MRGNENMQGFPESLAGLRGLGKGNEGERREEESWERDREGVKEGKGNGKRVEVVVDVLSDILRVCDSG